MYRDAVLLDMSARLTLAGHHGSPFSFAQTISPAPNSADMMFSEIGAHPHGVREGLQASERVLLSN